MESRVDKYIKDLDDRVKSNTNIIKEIYDLVIATITKKKQDSIASMTEVQEKETRLSNEKKSKISSHIESIDQFLSMQEEFDNLSDLEILTASKKRDDTLKQATKNAVDCSFTLSVIPELKKDVEINNFGKQLKNALRDQDNQIHVKSVKPKKTKKVPQNNNEKTSKESSDVTDTRDDNRSNDRLNTSHDTELSTPVLISAKTQFFEKPVSKQAKKPTSKPDETSEKKSEEKSDKKAIQKAAKKDNDLPPQPKTITTQVLNSRNSRQKETSTDVGSKNVTTAFNYQSTTTALEKLNKISQKPQEEKTQQVPSTVIHKNEKIESFNEFLDSAQQIQRDRAKRKRQNNGAREERNNTHSQIAMHTTTQPPKVPEKLQLEKSESNERSIENNILSTDPSDPKSVRSNMINDRS